MKLLIVAVVMGLFLVISFSMLIGSHEPLNRAIDAEYARLERLRKLKGEGKKEEDEPDKTFIDWVKGKVKG